MKNSLDLSRAISRGTLEVYSLINEIAQELNISYVVVGATARDLVLHHGYGARIKRATTDIDFGLQVESWADFEKVKAKLIENGYTETRHAHRLISPKKTVIDIVPFGSLEDPLSNIQWPPDGDFEMSVLGFQEAHDHAIHVVLQQEPLVEVSVVAPHGLALLKLISWPERDVALKKNDAKDLAYLIETYEELPMIADRAYQEDIMERYDWDLTLACAHILGKDSATIASDKTKSRILEILDNNLTDKDSSKLVTDMSGSNDFDEKFERLVAYSNGFREVA